MEINTSLYPLIPGPLLTWFEANKRPLPWRENATPYRVWISEIMLQQTRIEAAKPYFERFITALPTIESLAQASEEQVLKLWEGLGYYSRARNLHKAAKYILEHYNGVFPSQMEEIRELPGIGPYTAGAIGSIAFGLREPAVDGNVLRVIARLAGSEADVLKPSLRKEVTEGLRAVYPEGDQASALTQGIMELGETVCLPDGAPQCERCPLAAFCQTQKDGSWDRIPVRNVRQQRRIEKRTVLILHCGNKLALRKRPAQGLLASMWELPSLDGWQDAGELSLSDGVRLLRRGPDGKHVFSHLEWHMRSWILEAAEALPQYVWFAPDSLPAVPSAFRTFLPEKEKERKK